MRRLAATLRLEIRLFLRQGLCLVAALAALGLAGLLLAAESARASLLPAALFLYALLCGFGFCAFRVLRERREGVLETLDASPLRPLEYLAAKVAALCLPAVLGASLIALACRGAAFRPLPLALGMGAATALSALAGFLAASRHRTAAGSALGAAAGLLALAAPLIAFLPGGSGAERWAARLFWHPLQGPLGFLEAAMAPPGQGPAQWPFPGLGISLLWIGLALALCKRALGRLRESGGK